MQRLTQSNTTSRLFSMASKSAEIQVVAASGILLDIQSHTPDVAGRIRNGHAVVALDIEEAVRLEGLLTTAITGASKPSDHRQTALWSLLSEAEIAPRRYGWKATS